MNSRENFLECLGCRPHMGVPTFMFDTSFGTGQAGYTVADAYRNGFDGEVSARSICAGRRYLGHDAVPGSMISMDTRVFGAEIMLYDDRPPQLKRPAFSDPLELFNHDPSEIRCRTADEIIRSNNLIREMDPDAVVAAYVPSPFLFSAILRGLEPFLMDIMSEPGYTSDLMEFSTRCCEDLAHRHVDETESECGIIPGAYDNVDIVGAETVERICIPSLTRINGILKKSGMSVIFHPHGTFTEGQSTDILNAFIKTGFDCIYYGENCDHRKMCELAGGRVSVMGGADTATTIFLGPDEKIRSDVADVLDSTDGYSFIYSCSCSIDRNLDAQRLKTMMGCVRAH